MKNLPHQGDDQLKGQKLLSTFLILVIIGGVGYIVYSMFFLRNGGIKIPIPHNMEKPRDTSMHNMNMPAQPQQNYAKNSQAALNKDELNKSITMINQALELITIDPYSRTTVPNSTLGNLIGGQSPASQGTGTINIYPSPNSSVNINPNVNGAVPTNPNQTTISPGINFVFDQGKLFQLHNRIFLLAQGMMLLDELNDDLSNQAAALEVTPADYNTYIKRYNAAIQNKSKLSNALNILNQAFTLINLNPYAAPNGFQYNVQNMEQLHQGVYKLSQGLTSLSRLNDQFSRQMGEASLWAQSLTNMTPAAMQSDWVTNPYTLIIILLIIVVLLIVFTAIFRAFNAQGKNRHADEDGPYGKE